MKIFSTFFILCLAIRCEDVIAANEIVDILDNATDLSMEERSGLSGLFQKLQHDCDYIQINAVQGEVIEPGLEALMATTRWEFEQQLNETFALVPSITYDTELPTVEELIGTSNTTDMSQEQIGELLDMQSILAEALQEAQLNINEIVSKATKMEQELIKINIPKIITYIYKALRVFNGISVRGSRAAYCTYSYMPALNTSLHNIYEGVDCYTYTTHLIVRIQNETLKSVKTIRKNVFDLAEIYKKTSAKHSLMGKILTLILNATKIAKDILETYTVAKQGMDGLQNEVPPALAKSAQCGSSFVAKIPQMTETVSELSVCIRFVDETTTDYDFMQPE